MPPHSIDSRCIDSLLSLRQECFQIKTGMRPPVTRPFLCLFPYGRFSTYYVNGETNIYVCIRAVGIYLYIRWCWYEQKKMCTQHHSYRKIIRKERDKTDVPSPIGRECFPSDCFFFLPQKTPMQSDIPIAAAALLDRRPKSQNQLVLFDYSSPVKMAWQRIDN